MKKYVVVAGTLFFFTANVSAETGFSVDFLLGNADQETEIGDVTSVSGNSLSLGLRAAYAFNEYVAAELSYIHYREMEDSFIDPFGDTITEKVTTSSVNAGLKASLPIRNGFSLFGRAGASRWNYDVEESDSSLPGEVYKLSDDGIDFYYGAGAEYRASTNIRVALEYTNLTFDGTLNSVDYDHTINNIALSLGYAF